MGKKKIAQQSGSNNFQEKVAEGRAKARSSAKSGRGGKKLALDKARVYVNASYNNTVLTVTDMKGNVLGWASSGSLGFNGPKKATPFAASKVVAVVAEKLKTVKAKRLEVFVKGIGGGRDSSLRSLANHGFEIEKIKDVTPIPHNGPQPKKPRRV